MYVVDFLRSRRVWFERLLHIPASSATKLARSVHVPGREVAKTVLVKAGDGLILVVLPATSRIDLDRLGTALGIDPTRIRLATPEEIMATFHDCEPGTIPPFGRLYGLRTVVDASLAAVGLIVFGTNTRHEGMRMRFRDYEALEAPLRADFGRPITSGPARPSPRKRQRRAG
jgi:Ala-tRNA(Pro) deacylase